MAAIRDSASRGASGDDFAGGEHADLLRIVEALYAVEQAREEWMAGVLRAAAGFFGGGVACAFYYTSEDTLSLESIAARDVAPQALNAAYDDHSNPLYVGRIRAFYRTVLCETQNTYVLEAHRKVYEARLAEHRIHDSLLINGLDPSGRGIAMYLFSGRRILLTPQTRLTFERLAVHIAGAYRLVRRLEQLNRPPIDAADVVFDARGRLENMREPLERAQIEEIERALSERNWARGAARKEQPRKALAIWKALVDGRWSLVDHFEKDGKRFVVAQENSLQLQSHKHLSRREQQVASLAALGRSNKVIAYELGIAHSTVRVLLARAASRLGARDRNELIARLSGTSSTD